MNIREIIETEREAYHQLRSTLDNESEMWGAEPGERERLGDYAKKQFDSVLADDRSAIFVADEEGILAGFLSLETSPWKSLARTSVLMIGVLKAFQGRGVASQLFDVSEIWAQEKGIHRIELLVLADNTSAIQLYKKYGYMEEGIRKESSYIGNNIVDEIYMAKLLK